MDADLYKAHIDSYSMVDLSTILCLIFYCFSVDVVVLVVERQMLTRTTNLRKRKRRIQSATQSSWPELSSKSTAAEINACV